MRPPSLPRPLRRAPLLLLALGLVLTACGSEEDTTPDAASEADTGASEDAADAGEADEADEAEEAGEVDDPVDGDRLRIVATTSILADIVAELVEDDAEVETLMPPGIDPHGYEPSASDGRTLREADLIVANGLMLEENLVDVLEAVEEEGGEVLALADQLDPIDFDADAAGHGHDDDDDHAHDEDDAHDDDHAHDDDDDHAHDEDDAHEDDDGHDHGAEDPHFWFDPLRTAEGVELIAEAIAEVDDRLDAEEWMSRAEAYADELLELDAQLQAMFETIPPDNRVLVTNHDALGYLADRYDFELLGTVIPGASTQAETDSRSFAELVETIERAGVEVVFADNTDSTVLAEQLASEVVGRSDLDVEVVELYTGSLGEPGSGADSYIGMLRTTAMRITEALGGSA